MNKDNRVIPELPPAGQQLRLIIDTDAANEIDDLYAVGLALASPDRFSIEGFVATHFAQKAGPESIQASYDLLLELLAAAGMTGVHKVVRGGHPMQYLGQPSESDGARLIVERAMAGSEDNQLWVVGLGAATNLASAVLLEPAIIPRVRYVYHARSEWSWPKRSEQFNVAGDINAARVLLESGVPIVWFDTGQQITCPMSTTEGRLGTLAGLGSFLHEFRYRSPVFQSEDKGFFDLGDIAWMIDPSVCTNEICDVPHMDWAMVFRHSRDLGKMVRVTRARAQPIWEMFFDRLSAYSGKNDS
jgi:inosine-uridine nucleoside N-ribohydrolase